MELADTRRLGLSWARRVAHRLTAGGAPPSLRAQLVLLASAFLLGCVAAGLLFVGIWRHTAAEGERVRSAQLADRQALSAARREMSGLQAQVAHERASLAVTRRRAAALASELARTSAALRNGAGTLAPRLASIATAAGSLAHEAGQIQSELAAIQAYVANPGPSGVDNSYLTLQTSYLISAAAGAVMRANSVVHDAEQARAAATTLRRWIR